MPPTKRAAPRKLIKLGFEKYTMRDLDRLDKNTKVLDGEINRLDRNSEKMRKGVNDHIKKMNQYVTRIEKRLNRLEKIQKQRRPKKNLKK